MKKMFNHVEGAGVFQPSDWRIWFSDVVKGYFGHEEVQIASGLPVYQDTQSSEVSNDEAAGTTRVERRVNFLEIMRAVLPLVNGRFQ